MGRPKKIRKPAARLSWFRALPCGRWPCGRVCFGPALARLPPLAASGFGRVALALWPGLCCWPCGRVCFCPAPVHLPRLEVINNKLAFGFVLVVPAQPLQIRKGNFGPGLNSPSFSLQSTWTLTRSASRIRTWVLSFSHSKS